MQDSDEENGSEKSEEDDLAGTEHYVEVRYVNYVTT